MPSSKVSWQVAVALALLLLCGLWLLFQSLVLRILLAAALTVSVLVILACSGIFSPSGGNRPRKLDRDTQALAVFILVFSMLFALFSVDVVGNLGVWVAVMTLFVIFLAVLGVFVCGRSLGLLVDSRNRISLSNFQTILWTVVLLSAFFTAAAVLLLAGKGTAAFDITLDQQLWALMGISVTTLAGTPLIRDIKSERTVRASILKGYAMRHEKKVVEKALQTGRVTRSQNQSDAEVLKVLMADERALRDVLGAFLDGPLCKDKDPMTVPPIDIFMGDEAVNCNRLDMGKIQMFFFTVVGALAYMVILAEWVTALDPNAAVIAFPALSPGFIAILGISHAGFLGNAAAPKTPEEAPTT